MRWVTAEYVDPRDIRAPGRYRPALRVEQMREHHPVVQFFPPAECGKP